MQYINLGWLRYAGYGWSDDYGGHATVRTGGGGGYGYNVKYNLGSSNPYEWQYESGSENYLNRRTGDYIDAGNGADALRAMGWIIPEVSVDNFLDMNPIVRALGEQGLWEDQLRLRSASNIGYGMMFGDPPKKSSAGVDDIGLDIKYGFGYGIKSPYGNLYFNVRNVNVLSWKFSNNDYYSQSFMGDSNPEWFTLKVSLPIGNWGFGLDINERSGMDFYGTAGLYKLGNKSGASIDGTIGFHFGIIGAEAYVRTSETRSFIESLSHHRQNYYESTGFMWTIR